MMLAVAVTQDIATTRDRCAERACRGKGRRIRERHDRQV